MKPKEFYESLEEKKPFTKLTSTGISDNLPNVFDFAEMYAKTPQKGCLRKSLLGPASSPSGRFLPEVESGCQNSSQDRFQQKPGTSP